MENKFKYNNEVIEYEIVRTNSKSVCIQVKEGRVYLRVPKRFSVKIAREFVDKKADWIYKKVNETRIKKEKDDLLKESISEDDVNRLSSIVTDKVNKYSGLLGVRPNKVRIRDIKYAWGSCSSAKNITISVKLAKRDERLIEYVVLHEMCHIIHMNHSDVFWSLVGKYMPDYKECRKKLNKG